MFKRIRNAFKRNYSGPLTLERKSRELVGSSGTRYRNPLYKESMNMPQDPQHRWYVSNYDPIGKLLTRTSLMGLLSQPLFFYQGPGPEDPLIPQNDQIREALEKIDAKNWMIRAGQRQLVHGWQVTIPKRTPDGGIDLSECYSAHEIPIENIIRDGANHITGYRVSYVPELPFFQGSSNLRAINKIIPYNVAFHTTNISWEFGVGHSVFESVWDSITKLLEESENNHFRQSIFAQASLPPDWSEDDIKDWIQKAVYAMQNKQLFASQAWMGPDNKLYENIPSLNFKNQVQETNPSKSRGSGGGVFSDLTSEWARLCIDSGYSIRYFTGNPGGALEAADSDTIKDLYNDVARFSQVIDYLIKPFLKLLQSFGIIEKSINFNKVYIRSWVQVELNRRTLMRGGENPSLVNADKEGEGELEEQDKNLPAAQGLKGIDNKPKNDKEEAERKEKEKKTEKIKNEFKHMLNQKIVSDVTSSMMRCGAVDVDIKYNIDRTKVKWNLNLPMYPVASSTVKGFGLSDNEVLVEFHPSGSPSDGGYYAYQFPSEELAYTMFDMMSKSTSMGGFVWDVFRGDSIGPSWDRGVPTAGGTFASQVPYVKTAVLPIPEVENYDERAAELKKFKEEGVAQTAAQQGEVWKQDQPGLELGSPGSERYGRSEVFQELQQMFKTNNESANKIEKWFGVVANSKSGARYGKNLRLKTNQIIEQAPELLKDDFRYYFDSMDKAAEAIHKSKTTLYTQMKESKSRFRYNKLDGGTFQKSDDEFYYAIVSGFNKTNPFHYVENGRITTEYQCEKDIKKQVGKVVPLGIYHNLEDDNSVDLPEWQIVGTYEVLGYDEVLGKDEALIKVNKKKIKEFFGGIKEPDWITPLFESGKVPDVSTAYPAIVKYNEEHKVYVQTDFELKSVAIVPQGNCSGTYCTGEILKMNAALRDCIKEQMKVLNMTGKTVDEVAREAVLNCNKVSKVEQK